MKKISHVYLGGNIITNEEKENYQKLIKDSRILLMSVVEKLIKKLKKNIYCENYSKVKKT